MSSTVQDSTGMAYGRVPAGRGVDWWTQGFRNLFAPGMAGVWIGMVVVFIVIAIVAQVVPLVGSLAGAALSFVMTGGLMLAARKSTAGTAPDFQDLFAGFGPRLGPLVIAGLLVWVASFVVGLLMVLFGVGGLMGSFGSAMGGMRGLSMSLGVGALAVLLVGLLLFIPISLAAWFAPALVMLRGIPPVEALKASLAASWANLGALTVYGLLFIVFSIVASIPFGLGWIVFLPVCFLSTYLAYVDLLGDAVPAVAGPSAGISANMS